MTSVSIAQLPPAFHRAPKEVQEAFIKNREEGARERTSVNRREVIYNSVGIIAAIALFPLTALTGCEGTAGNFPYNAPPRDFDTEPLPASSETTKDGRVQETVYDESLVVDLENCDVRISDGFGGHWAELAVGYTDPQWRFRMFRGDVQYLVIGPQNFYPEDAETIAFGISGLNGRMAEGGKADISGKCMAVINPDTSQSMGINDYIVFPKIYVRVGTVPKNRMLDIFGSNLTWKDLFVNPEDDVLIFKETATIQDVRDSMSGITPDDLGMTEEEFKDKMPELRWQMEKIFTDHKEDKRIAEESADNDSHMFLKGAGNRHFWDTGATLQMVYQFKDVFQSRLFAYADRDIISQIPGTSDGRMLDPDMASMRISVWNPGDGKGVPPAMWVYRDAYNDKVYGFNTLMLIQQFAPIDEKHAIFTGPTVPDLPEGWPAVQDRPEDDGKMEDGITYYNAERNAGTADIANGIEIRGRQMGSLMYAAPDIPILDSSGRVIGNQCYGTRNVHAQFMIINTGFADPENMTDLWCNINFFQQNTE